MDGEGAAKEAEAVDGEGAAKEAEAVDGEGAAKEAEAVDEGAAEEEAVDGEGAAKEAEAVDGEGAAKEAEAVDRRRGGGGGGRRRRGGGGGDGRRGDGRRGDGRRGGTTSRQANDSWKRRPRRRRRLRSRRRLLSRRRPRRRLLRRGRLPPLRLFRPWTRPNSPRTPPPRTRSPRCPLRAPSSLSPSPAPSEDPRAVLVTCKNKTGRFQPSSRLIRCECAPCVAATAAGAHAVSWHDPRRWEQHCGMGHAKSGSRASA